MATVISAKEKNMTTEQGKGKLHKYYGDQNHSKFKQDVAEQLTISPGGAKTMLKCSREFIHQLIESEEVEAWVEYTGFLSQRAGQIEVSVLDIVRYGLKSGRITKDSVLGYFLDKLPEVRELLDNYKADGI